jgi:hypothetical protein
MTTKICHRSFVRTSTCAGLASAMTAIVCWSILASTATVRWMGSDSLIAPNYTAAAMIMSSQSKRVS